MSAVTEVLAPTDIRNVLLLGHAHAGKTSLADACLHVSGTGTRLGRVDDGSSVADSDPEEKERHHSLDSHVLHCEHADKEINLLDTPGMPDFVGGAIGAAAAAEIAVIVVSAPAGIESGARKMFAFARDAGLARMVVVNKCDADKLDLPALIGQIREAFGPECRPVNLPDGAGRDFRSLVDCLTGEPFPAVMPVAGARTDLIEAAVGIDEALIEKYLGGEPLSAAEVAGAVRRAVHDGALVPIVFVSARTEVGVREFLDTLVKYGPSPAEMENHRAVKADGTSVAVHPDPDGPFVGQVFKVAYPTRGKLAFVKVLSGRLRADTTFTVNSDAKHVLKAGHIYRPQGAETKEIAEAVAGDIVAVGRLESLHLHDLLHANGDLTAAVAPNYPVPMYSLAVEPKTRSDVDKVSNALHELVEEDRTLTVDIDPRTGERVLHGLGEMHLRIALNRLRRKRGLEVNTKPPKVPYRETITQAVRGVEHTHKKQTGGAGQFARVVIDIEPLERGQGYEFEDAIYGGSISQSFRPAVSKGIQLKMAEGVLAGYPVTDVKVSLTDGKEHPVDSKDIAFQIAGREAFKKAFLAAKPVLLEPIVHIDVTVPADFVGAVNGQLASRRGRIVGSDTLAGGQAVVKALLPLSEVFAYGNQLQSATAGQGGYTIEFSHYEPVPAAVQQQLVAAYKPKDEE
jgi:elongation factor G